MKQLLIAFLVMATLTTLHLTTTTRNLQAKKHHVAHKVARRVAKKILRKHAPSHKSFASKTTNIFDTKGATRGVALGKGNTASFAGPQGTQTEAQGTRGTKNASSFATKGHSAYDNWGRSSGKFGNTAFATKGIKNQNIKAAGQGESLGKGKSGSTIGEKGAKAHANGTKGAASGASWNGKGDNAQNSFGVANAN